MTLRWRLPGHYEAQRDALSNINQFDSLSVESFSFLTLINGVRSLVICLKITADWKFPALRSAERRPWKFGWLTATHTWQYFKQNTIYILCKKKKKQGGRKKEKKRHLWAPRVIRCTGVSRGHLGLDLLTSLFFTRLSQKHQTSLTPSSPPPCRPALAPCCPAPIVWVSSGKQNACSYGAGTKKKKRSFHRRTHTAAVKRCHGLNEEEKGARERKPGACLLSFILLARAENFSPRIKEAIMANMADIPTVVHNHCVCECDRQRQSVICAMKKPIVVAQVFLISVYTNYVTRFYDPRSAEKRRRGRGGDHRRTDTPRPSRQGLAPPAQRLRCLLIYGVEQVPQEAAGSGGTAAHFASREDRSCLKILYYLLT